MLLILIFITACKTLFVETEEVQKTTKEKVQISQPEVSSQETIFSCTSDEDCIIVENIECTDCDCVKAINKKHLTEWNRNITFHQNDKCEFLCKPCIDFDVTKARCENNTCTKIFTN